MTIIFKTRYGASVKQGGTDSARNKQADRQTVDGQRERQTVRQADK